MEGPPEQYTSSAGLVQGAAQHSHGHGQGVPPEVMRVLEAAGQNPAASQQVLQQYIDSLHHLQAAQAANAVLGDMVTTAAPQNVQLRSLANLPLSQGSFDPSGVAVNLLPQVATASHQLQAKPQEAFGGLSHISEILRLPNTLTIPASASKADVPLIALGKVLLVPLAEKEILKAPVVTLQGSRQLSIYFTIEQIMRAEFLHGAERFWKVLRNAYEPPLETWRPRVQGQQLKALNKVRLPETDEEWQRVSAVLHALSGYFRPNADVAKALRLFKELRALVEDVWTGRKKDSRDAAIPRKRSVADMSGGHSFDAQKRQVAMEKLRSHTASPAATAELQGQMPTAANNDLQLILQTRDANVLPTNDHSSPAGNVMLEQQAPDPQAMLNNLQKPMSSSLIPPSVAEFGLQSSSTALMTALKAGIEPGVISGSSASRLLPSQAMPNVAPIIASAPSMGQQPTVIPTGAIESDEDLRLVKLIVGGSHFWTTSATLCSVKGSFFWEHSGTQWPSSNGNPLKPAEELFIDRDGTNFKYILKFLRLVKEHSKSNGTQQQMLDAAVDSMILPNCLEALEDLRADAKFYKLPDLELRIVKKLNEGKDDRWETLFFETGYQPHAEKQMQLPEVAIRQLAEKQERGFKIVQIQPAVHYASHSDGTRPDGSALQNVVVNAHWVVTLRKRALIPSE